MTNFLVYNITTVRKLEDDNPENIKSTLETLNMYGIIGEYDVIEAENVEDAIRKFHGENND